MSGITNVRVRVVQMNTSVFRDIRVKSKIKKPTFFYEIQSEDDLHDFYFRVRRPPVTDRLIFYVRPEENP